MEQCPTIPPQLPRIANGGPSFWGGGYRVIALRYDQDLANRSLDTQKCLARAGDILPT